MDCDRIDSIRVSLHSTLGTVHDGLFVLNVLSCTSLVVFTVVHRFIVLVIILLTYVKFTV